MNSESYYNPAPVIDLGEQSRATFIARTYAHLFGAVMAFIAIEVFLFKSGLAEILAQAMLSVSWLFGWVALSSFPGSPAL